MNNHNQNGDDFHSALNGYQNGDDYYSAFNGFQNGVSYNFSGSPLSYSPAVYNLLTPEINSLSPQIGSVPPISSPSPSDDYSVFHDNLSRVIMEQRLQYGQNNVLETNMLTGAEVLALMAGETGANALTACPLNIDNNLWNENHDNVYIISSVGDEYMDNGQQAGNGQFHTRGVHAVVINQLSVMILFTLFDRAGRFRDQQGYWTWTSMQPDADGMWDVTNQRLIIQFLNTNNRLNSEPNMGFDDLKFDE